MGSTQADRLRLRSDSAPWTLSLWHYQSRSDLGKVGMCILADDTQRLEQ